MRLLSWRMMRYRRKLCVVSAALASFILLFLKLRATDHTITGIDFVPEEEQDFGDGKFRVIPPTGAVKPKTWKERIAGVFNEGEEFPPPNYDIHVFYYTWYGNPRHDGKYIHWNHPFLRHWNPAAVPKYQTGIHAPPDDIGANFYPALGPYSSRDPSVIEVHMQQLRTAAIGVLALSWYPPNMNDDNGEPTDDIVPLILEVAAKYQVKVVFHIEPYEGRNDKTMLKNIKYIIDKYGDHPAFFRYRSSTGKLLPLFYIYDSYLQSSAIWGQLLKTTGIESIRNTPYDGIFIALLVKENHQDDILEAGFDGVYTYFATNSFTYGSTQANWNSIKAFCDRNDLIFIPSVGPGYIDTSIRPWNGHNTRNRINGKYYETSLKAALETRPKIISVTSFNEWHEGTQIESAIPKSRRQTPYLDYLPYKPTVYLDITRRWAMRFRMEKEKWKQDFHNSVKYLH